MVTDMPALLPEEPQAWESQVRREVSGHEHQEESGSWSDWLAVSRAATLILTGVESGKPLSAWSVMQPVFVFS